MEPAVILATNTGPASQFRDAHGAVRYTLRLPTNGQRRSKPGLMRDYRASLKSSQEK